MSEEQWVAFLRAINVAGRRITNEALCRAVAEIGCEDPRAHQASGNVVLRDGRERRELLRALEEGLADRLGYPVPVFLRRGDEVRAIAAAEPFTSEQLAASPGKRQVILLTSELPDDTLDELDELVPDDEVVVADGSVLHWLPPGGVSDSALPMRRLDELVGGTTVRTHGSIQRLVARFL